MSHASPPDQARALPRPIAEFVPHRSGMCLLDTLIAADEHGLTARLTPRADGLFVEAAGASAQGIPAWVGVEWLAQAVAAWAGWHAAQRGQAPAVGFLVGCRKFVSHQAHFPIGESFEVRIRCDFVADNGLGQFSGEIAAADEASAAALAEGRLTIYQPPHNDTAHAP
ncbi:hypothetical protein R6258_11090 [Halomonas sp. HP20-15]|uniref:ApeP family dehydratase n=1 Tax=Halomonas sp. HP20-15 TaxID=3085901 RepID=UPI00298132A0|nr:hypothetical protein [Halomonas sp. HP20-15]MDW5377462.1 hypothetical protein [Halomonas sp. HP20-15]